MREKTARLYCVISVLAFVCAFAGPASASPTQEIRSFLEGLDAGGDPAIAGQQLNLPGHIATLYRERNHAPIWLTGAPLALQLPEMLRAIDDSVGHGFSAQRYHRDVIEDLIRAGNDEQQLALELLLSDAFLTQALHRRRGAVYPPNLDADWTVPPAEIDVIALLQETSRDKQRVAEVLDALWPDSREYDLLVKRRAELVGQDESPKRQMPAGPLLRPGQTADRVVDLKERLWGPGDHTPLYDDALQSDVKALQRAAGLEPDGIVGDNTLEILNSTSQSLVDRIDANLERWRWLPRETPSTYLRVNIAAYSLRIIEDGSTTASMNVIVGLPYRRTPVFAESIKYLVLNPYWNVPYSIATKDKLPLLKANSAAEAAKGFEVKPAGQDEFIPVDQLDWSDVTARNFRHLLRQRPGVQNALGRVKIMMPNPYAVYLHDTPAQELFSRHERSFSSGCIRLEQPFELTNWLLRHDGNPAADQVTKMLETGNTATINLATPLPVHIVYFTAFEADGDVVFRRDIYSRDRAIVEALRAP